MDWMQGDMGIFFYQVKEGSISNLFHADATQLAGYTTFR